MKPVGPRGRRRRGRGTPRHVAARIIAICATLRFPRMGNKDKMRPIASFALSTLLALVGCEADVPTLDFGIDGRALICVPRKDVAMFQRDSARSNLHLVPNDSPQEVFVAQFSATVIRKIIKDYHMAPGYADDDSPNALYADFTIVDREYRQRPLGSAAGPELEAIWDRSDDCASPIIERISNSSTYLAKCNQGDVWHILFDRMPGTIRPRNLAESVLAECTHTSVDFGEHKNSELENCRRRILIDQFRVDYDFQVENATLIHSLDAFLIDTVQEWKRNCLHG